MALFRSAVSFSFPTSHRRPCRQDGDHGESSRVVMTGASVSVMGTTEPEPGYPRLHNKLRQFETQLLFLKPAK